jgi:hypothetical protein
MIGRSRFDPRQGQRIFLLTPASRPALGSTQPPVQWIPGVLSPWVKSGRGVTLTIHPPPPSSAEVKNEYELYLPPPQAPPWRVGQLTKLKTAVFWVVALCSLVEVYQRCRGAFCLHNQGDHSTSETSVNFYLTTWHNNPEDRHLHIRRRENLKSHLINTV